MDIFNKILYEFEIFGIEIQITQTLVSTWVLMGLLIVFALIAKSAVSKFQTIPTGFQNAVESLIELVENFVRNTAGENLMELAPWFLMLVLFIFTSNISGIVGLRPPTTEWSTNFALALCSFYFIQKMGIKHRKKDYLKSLVQPIFLFLPINIIGELSKPISLSFRLFGNMLSGLILMAMVYSMPVYLRILIPIPLHMYFDLAIGALQTYIFCLLSLSFIRNAAISAS
ncbi:MAG: F0F1 ATP synthase subunit A [Oscillospiraceae bacterium]|nr:F0F1 ATP synthase subunit A [Oscillospiraceae bacterium]